jgi:hypothetical protein
MYVGMLADISGKKEGIFEIFHYTPAVPHSVELGNKHVLQLA